MRIIENGSVHDYEEFTLDTRPQAPYGDGTGLTFTTLEHGGDEPDNMPQAILLTDAQGRTYEHEHLVWHIREMLRLPLD